MKIEKKWSAKIWIIAAIVVIVTVIGGIYYFKTPVVSEPISQVIENSITETFEQKVWKQRIDAAFEPTNCVPVSGPKYGSLYYKGPLIDSHYHIPHIPDHSPWEKGDGEIDNVRPLLGKNIKISEIICTLEQENTTKIFAFFPVYPPQDKQYMEVVKRTMRLYPEKFVPFIMTPDRDNSIDGSPTVEAKILKDMLSTHPDLFRGYGEIGLYARGNGGAAELPPDSQRLLDIYPVIREYNLIVYFHLGQDHKNNFEKVLEHNPDINFIWHGDQLSVEEVEDIIANHPNVYYTIDELYGDQFLLRPGVTKKEFLEHLEDHEPLLEKDLDTWKDIIERNPDQFMWGTDRSDQIVWSHDPEVGQALANYGRTFIARLGVSVQEKFAYKNAERLLSQSMN